MSSFLITCDACKQSFGLGSVVIDEAFIDLDEGRCRVSYFVCPRCKAVYLVAIYDEVAEKRKEDLDKHLARVQRLWGKVSERESRSLDRMTKTKRNRLSRRVESLKRKYQGSFTYVPPAEGNGNEELAYVPR